MRMTKALITEEHKTQRCLSEYLRYANTTHFHNRCLTQGISYTNYPLTQITGQLKLRGVKEALSQTLLPNLQKGKDENMSTKAKK